MSAGETYNNSFGMRAVLKLASAQSETPAAVPETRLWCAIILSTLVEYQEWLQRISSAWHRDQRPVPRGYLYAVQCIRKQCGNEWFVNICELAGVSLHQVVRRFDSLDREFCIASIPFEEAMERIVSPWELRKAARRKLIN